MANNPLLNELIEEKVYPIVDSIKGFFGSFGIADRLSQPGSNTGSPTRSGSSVAASPSYIDARASLQSGVTIPERYLVSSNLPPYVPPRSFSPPADVGFHVNGQSTSSVAVSTTPISHPAPAVAAVAAVATPSTAVEGTPQSHDNASSTHSTPNHVTTGNHRAPGAPVSVAGGLNQQTARTGSFHGDVSRSAKARLGNPPLRAAASVDSTGIIRSLGAAGPEAHSSPRQSNFSSLSSQFRQTFAERGTAGSTQSNGGGNSAASSIDHHDGDQTETPSTPNNRASISGTSGSAADDSGDAYAAALAVSAGADKLGRLQFSVSYDFDAQTLTVKIIKAESLAAKDLSGTSDPYVKISLLPDKKHTLTTNIKRKNLNPRWNEVFAFEGFPYNKVVMKTLHLLVLDYDRFSRDDPIGEVCLPLGDLDLATGLTMWKTLLPCKGAVGKLGVLQLSLCYQPTDESITVEIIKARDLKAKDINGLSDPYVKIWMTHEGKKIEKKKTSVKEKNLNPIFNETFLFTVPYERIRQTSLVVSVMDYDRMGRNEAIGQLVLGPKSGPIEMKHWNEMFAKTRQPVTQWHLLKDFG